MTIRSIFNQKVKCWVLTQANHLLLRRSNLYFLIKLLFIASIIIQRIGLALDIALKDTIAIIMWPVLYFLLFLLEGALYRIISKKQRFQGFTDLFFFLFQIIFSECSIALSSPLVSAIGDKINIVLKQEVLFVCFNTLVFTNSIMIRFGLLLYASSTVLFRLSEPLEMMYYISSFAMAAVVLVGALYTFLFSQDIVSLTDALKTKNFNDFAKLETIPHGLAILSKDKDVIFMNGVFKGILDLSDESDALQEILKLKNYDSYPEEVKQRLLREINLRGYSSSGKMETPIHFNKINSTSPTLLTKDFKSIRTFNNEKPPIIFIKKPSLTSSKQFIQQNTFSHPTPLSNTYIRNTT